MSSSLYGFAIILFSVFLKLLLLPMTIKQQKTLKKSQKVQAELKVIQDKYKNFYYIDTILYSFFKTIKFL